MKLLNLGTLITLPMLLLAQGPVSTGDEAPVSTVGAVADSPSANADSPSVPTTEPAALMPLTPMQKVERRMRRMVEPDDLLFAAAGAGIDQWRNVPSPWGQGAIGYADRFASAEGYVAAHNAVATGFDIALHLDPRYRRMPGAGFKARVWNAVSQTFVANKDSGGKMINVSEIAGNFSAGFIANTWEPTGYNSPMNGLERGAMGLGYHTVKNLLREFLPNLRLHKVTDTTGTGPGTTVAEQR